MSESDGLLKTLTGTIKASRLSKTKVDDVSAKTKSLKPEEETKFITTFLRLFSSLPPCNQSRISALYLFDAVARANKGHKGREGMMNKMESVAENLIGGMIDDGKGGVWSEGRDKTRKIIEIWKKSSTFPKSCLENLSSRMAGSSTPVVVSTTPPPSIMSPALPPITDMERRNAGSASGTPAQAVPSQGQGTTDQSNVPAGSLPAEIQKLLGISAQMAASSDSKTNAPTSSSTGQVDLAAILSNLVPQSASAPPSASPHPPTQSNSASTVAPSTALAAILPGLNLDPAQLASLANLAKLQNLSNSIPSANPAINPSYPVRPGPSQNYSHPGPSQYSHTPPPINGPGPSGGHVQRQGYNAGQSANGYGPSQGSSSSGYGGPVSPPGRGGEGPWASGHERRFSADRPVGRDRDEGWGRQGGQGGSRNRSRSPDRSVNRYNDRGPPGNNWNGGAGPAGGTNGPGFVRGGRGDRGPSNLGHSASPHQGALSPAPHGDSFPNQPFSRGGPPMPNFPPTSITNPVVAGANAIPVAPVPVPRGRAAMPVQPGKDEFGRDLPTSGGDNAEEEDMALDQSDDEGNNQKPTPNAILPNPAAQAATPYGNLNAGGPVMGNVGSGQNLQKMGPSLDTFDRSQFNPADPSAWMMLGLAWKGTVGREPNQMELMEYLATGQVGGMMAAMSSMMNGGMVMNGGLGGMGMNGGMGNGGMGGPA